MKRIFAERRLYDYSTVEEAEKHIEEMRKKGWVAIPQENAQCIFNNGQDEMPYSVEFIKQR